MWDQGLQKSNICKYLQGPIARSVEVEAHQISAICSKYLPYVCTGGTMQSAEAMNAITCIQTHKQFKGRISTKII